MKPLFDIALLLTWVVSFLGMVYAVGYLRQAWTKTRGRLSGGQFRAERDSGVRVAILVGGLLLGAVAYLVSRAFGQVL